MEQVSASLPFIGSRIAVICDSRGKAQTYTYTATKACCVCGQARLWGIGSTAIIRVNESLITTMGGGDNNQGTSYPLILYLKAGQKFSIEFNTENNGTNTVYAYALTS